MANKSRSRQIHKVLKKHTQNRFKKAQPFINYKSNWDDCNEFNYFEIQKRKSSDRKTAYQYREQYTLLISNIRKELHRFWFVKNDFNFSKTTFEITQFSPKIRYCFSTTTHEYVLECSKSKWKLWIKSIDIYSYNLNRGRWYPVHTISGRQYVNQTQLNKIEDLKLALHTLISLRDFDVTNKIINTVEDLYS